MFLLLLLLEFLLLLVVLLFKLLQLLLLFLFELLTPLISLLLSLVWLRRPLIGLLLPLIWLRRSLIALLLPLIWLRRPLIGLLLLSLLTLLGVSIFLFELLALLRLLLLEFLALLILLVAHVLKLLLVLLLELRIVVVGRARRRWPVVIGAWITAALVSVSRSVVFAARLAWRIYIARRPLPVWIPLLHVRPIVGPVVLNILRRSLRRRICLVWLRRPIGITLRLLRDRPVCLRVLRRTLLGGRRNLYGRVFIAPRAGGNLRLHMSQFRNCRRSAAIGLNDLLLFGK